MAQLNHFEYANWRKLIPANKSKLINNASLWPIEYSSAIILEINMIRCKIDICLFLILGQYMNGSPMTE